MKASKAVFITVVIAIFQHTYVYPQVAKAIDPSPQILKILDEHKVPGVGVALLSKDSIIWMEALGRADHKHNVSVTENTLFSIGSLSKTFLSMAALVAQEQEIVNINDPIEQIVPSLVFSNPWSPTDPVRLVHLLEHTSGFDEAHFNLFSQADSSTPLSEVMKSSKNSLVARWRPGHYYAYNNLGAVMAAYVLEKAADQPFEDFVRENMLLPLDMQQSTYHPTETTPNLSRGYAGTDYTEEPFPDIPQWPAGSLLASIKDMADVVSLFLNNGKFKNRQLLTALSIKRMETPETSLRAEQGIQYGYGKGLRTKFENGHLFYGHDGSYGGFLSEFGYSRELDVGYVILLNNRDGNKAIKAIKQELLPYLIPEEESESSTTSQENIHLLPSIAGCYQPIVSDMEITQFMMRLIDLQFVVEEDGQWYQKSIVGDKQFLLPISDTQFKRSGETIATSAFVNTKDGSWQWLDEVTYQQIPVWWGYFQFYVAVACILTMLLAFLTLLFWIPVQLIKKKKYFLLQMFPLMAVGSFAGMVISLTTLYNPFELYSPGAVLFLIFGWLFLLFSFIGLVQILSAIYRRVEINAWIKYPALLASVACCITATYLLYWNIIGLTLWNY